MSIKKRIFSMFLARVTTLETPYGLMAGEDAKTVTGGFAYFSFTVPEGKNIK